MWLNSAVASKLQSWESQKSCYAIYYITMAECQTVTVTTVVVTVTVVMVVEVVVKSTKSTTSPLWGIENSVMASNMFKHVQTYPEIIKRSWKTAKKTKPHSQVAIVEAIHRCVGASWQNDDFVVCLCAQSSFASKNTSQIALPISLEFPWLPGWDSGEIGQREVHFVLCGLAAIRGVCTSWKKDFFPTSRLYKTDSNRLNRLKSADIPKLLNWIRAAFWNDRQWRRSRRNVPA